MVVRRRLVEKLLRLETLEDRRVLAGVTVGNLLDVVNGDTSSIANLIASDGGDGVSLREAITAANNTAGADTIDFSVTGQIDIGSQLPTITDDLVIDGPGAFDLRIDAGLGGDSLKNGNGYRIFNIDDGTGGLIDVEINELKLQGGDPESFENGGAVFSSENLTLRRSIVTGNASQSRGGGVYNNYGTLEIDGTLLWENGAIYGGAVSSYGGTTTITNSTLSMNSADFGGAIANTGFGGGTVDIQHSTITGNHAGSGGGIYNTSFVTLGHTLLAGNTSSTNFGIEIENFGGVTLDDYNLFGHSGLTTAGALGVGLVPGPTDITATSDGDQPTPLAVVVNPLLSDNGGATLTHPLPAGSPAANSGDPGFTSPPAFDQRGAGFPRVFAGRIDVGAFESPTEAPSLVVTSSSGSFNPFDQLTSLPEAVALANDQPGADTITFDPLFLNGGSNSLIRLASPLVITDLLVIDGSTAPDVVISGDAAGDDTLVAGGFVTDVAASLLNDPTSLDDNLRVIDITDGGGMLTLNQVTITGGRASAPLEVGGGILNRNGAHLVLTGSTVSGNSTGGTYGYGGGIFMDVGSLTVTGSTISDNISNREGGGVHVKTSGVLTFTRSTVSGNSGGREGGGISLRDGNLNLTESTVSGNTASGISARGGGLSLGNAAAVITNSTITGNSASGVNPRGGGIYIPSFYSYQSLTIEGSIIAGNTADTGPDLSLDTEIEGTLTVNHSLFGDTSESAITGGTGTGNLLDIDPLLGPLADNGGTTQTHALLSGSPAIDAGDSSILFDPLEFDQRGPGFTRVADGDMLTVIVIDIGAYEAQFPPSADFDSDGDVDLFDLLRQQRGFGARSGAVLADGNSDDDGDVDASDQAAWDAAFGEGASPVLAFSALMSEPAEAPWGGDGLENVLPVGDGESARTHPIATTLSVERPVDELFSALVTGQAPLDDDFELVEVAEDEGGSVDPFFDDWDGPAGIV